MLFKIGRMIALSFLFRHLSAYRLWVVPMEYRKIKRNFSLHSLAIAAFLLSIASFSRYRLI